MIKSLRSNEQIMSQTRTSHKQVENKVMNKLRILSHEQAMTKPWTSHEQVIEKLSHEDAMCKS